MTSVAYFSDRCMAVIAGNLMAPRCGLKLGHEGSHEPIKVGKQAVTYDPPHGPEPPDFTVPGDDLGY